MIMKTTLLMLASLFFVTTASTQASATTTRIVALGDSLTAGYGLQSGESYTHQLEKSLLDKKYDVRIDNAGVSGDTSAGGLARLNWAIEGDPKPSLVIVALGANDMLRGIDPSITEENLRKILTHLKEQKIPAILFGMRAPFNMPSPYRAQFDPIYKKLAKEFDTPLYPFFLDGVAFKADLNLGDGIHPNKAGIAVMVDKTLPVVEKSLKQAIKSQK
jgi:acyl-CoA thioesterase-1